MNNEKIEKQLISLILECSKQSLELTKKYLPQTKKLFESVFYQEEITPPVNLKECRNNKYAYFQQVKYQINQLSEIANEESMRIINESIATPEFQGSIKSFINDLTLEIDNLKYQDDFVKLDTYESIVRKTLFFAGKPVVVNGFNIMELLNPEHIISMELKETFGALPTDLKVLFFNKSDKELYFVYERRQTKEQTIIFYNVKNNELDYLGNKDFYKEFGSDKNEFFKEFWSNENKYFQSIGKYINNNLVELYRNNDLFDMKFIDNLYGDFAFQERNQILRNQNVIQRSR